MNIKQLLSEFRQSTKLSPMVVTGGAGGMQVNRNLLGYYISLIEDGEVETIIFTNYMWPTARNVWAGRFVVMELDKDNNVLIRSDLFIDKYMVAPILRLDPKEVRYINDTSVRRYLNA